MTATDPLLRIPIRDLAPDGSTLIETRSFRDIGEKLECLAEMARTYARKTGGLLGPRTLEAWHAWVRDSIQYADEPEEMLETPAYTTRARFGDCDAQACLLAALVVASGAGSAMIVPMGGSPEDPAHVTVLVKPGPLSHFAGHAGVWVGPWSDPHAPAPAGWSWAETTIPNARFGESPGAANDRRGRTDFTG
jgi:hypothetical protein